MKHTVKMSTIEINDKLFDELMKDTDLISLPSTTNAHNDVIIESIKNADIATLQTLVQQGVNVLYYDEMCTLDIAVQYKHLEVVKYLLTLDNLIPELWRKFHIRNALERARSNGCLDIAIAISMHMQDDDEILQDCKQKMLNEDLIKAVQGCHYQIAMMLMEAGAKLHLN